METLVIKTLEFLKGQSIQVAIVFVAVMILTWLLRNKSAHVRYLLWLLVVIKCLTPPLVIFSVPVLPAQTISVVTQAQPVEIDYQPIQNTAIAIQPNDTQSQAPIENRTSKIENSSPRDRQSKIYPQGIENSPITRLHLTSTGVLLSLWAAGAVCYLLWALGKAVRLAVCLRRIRRPLPAQLMIEQIEMLTRLWDYPGGFNVWLVDGINQPFVWGLWRGAIYLPTRFQSIEGDKQKAIVLHEMAHVVRFDAFVNLIQILIQGVFWFHPLVWLANRAIRQEREKCCDEIAVARLGTAPKEYGSAIVDTLLQEAQSSMVIPTLAVAGPVKNIEDRIKTIMQPGKQFFRRPSMIALLIIGLLAVVTIPTTIALTQKVTPPDYTLSGIVTDANDRPIAGAIVFDDGYGPEPYQKGITNESGRFEYKSWNEEHNVTAKAEGFQPQSMIFTTFPQDNSKKLNFKMQKSPNQQKSAIRIMMEMIAVPNEEQELRSLFDQAGLKVPQFAMAGIQGVNPQPGSEKLSYSQYIFLSPQDRNNIIKATQSNPKISFLTSPKAIVASGEEVTMEVSTSPGLPKRVSSFKMKPSITKDGVLAEFNILYLNTIGTEDDPNSRIVSQTTIQSNILIPQDKTLLMISPETFKDQNTNQKPPQRLLFLVKTQIELLPDESAPAQVSLPDLGNMPGGMGAFIAADSSPFTATLPDGVTVELLGVCEDVSQNKWWKPDGTVFTPEKFVLKENGVNAVSKPYHDRIFLTKITGPDGMDWGFGNVLGSIGTLSLEIEDSSGKSVPDLHAYKVHLDPSYELTDVMACAAAGAWKTVATQTPGSGVSAQGTGDHGITFAGVIEKEDKIIVTASDDMIDMNHCLVAVDKDGKEYFGSQPCSSAGKTRLTTAEFKNLDLKQVKEFQFRVRPYQQVVFKNVSLKPGLKTDVKIEILPPQDETKQNQSKAMEIFDNPKFKKRFHVTIVVDKNNEISGDGQKVTFEQLDAMMPQNPEPASTVLEVAFEPGAFPDIHAQYKDNPVFQQAGQLVKKYKLEYLSYVGEDHPENRRGPLSIRTEDIFEMDNDIVISMSALELQEDKPLLTINWIRFSNKDLQLSADMMMTVISHPQKRWEIKVRLLDKDGKQIDSEVNYYQNPGLIADQAVALRKKLDFNFGQLNVAAITKFEIEIREMQNIQENPAAGHSERNEESDKLTAMPGMPGTPESSTLPAASVQSSRIKVTDGVVEIKTILLPILDEEFGTVSFFDFHGEKIVELKLKLNGLTESEKGNHFLKAITGTNADILAEDESNITSVNSWGIAKLPYINLSEVKKIPIQNLVSHIRANEEEKHKHAFLYLSLWQQETIDNGQIAVVLTNNGIVVAIQGGQFDATSKKRKIKYIILGKADMNNLPEPQLLQQLPSSEAEKALTKNNSETEFVTEFPNGVTVELVGICKDVSQNNWWKPDGNVLYALPRMDKQGVLQASPRENQYGYLFRLTGISVHDTYLHTIEWEDGTVSNEFGIDYKNIPADLSGDIQLEIPAGQWNIALEIVSGDKQSYKLDTGTYQSVMIEDAFEEDGKAHLPTVFVRQLGETQYFMTFEAIDDNGLVYPAELHYFQANRKERSWDSIYEWKPVYRFDVKPEKIQRYRLKYRPIHVVTFKNVSLKPGQKTDVKVEIPEELNSKI